MNWGRRRRNFEIYLGLRDRDGQRPAVPTLRSTIIASVVGGVVFGLAEFLFGRSVAAAVIGGVIFAALTGPLTRWQMRNRASAEARRKRSKR